MSNRRPGNDSPERLARRLAAAEKKKTHRAATKQSRKQRIAANRQNRKANPHRGKSGGGKRVARRAES